jgi:hypothetical protein
MMQYTFELISVDSGHLAAAAEPLNELAKERWTVIAVVPFGAGAKSYLVLLGREKEERVELLEPMAVDKAIINQLPSTTAN